MANSLILFASLCISFNISEFILGRFFTGQADSSFCSQDGPCHHNFDWPISKAHEPLVAISAGFSSDQIYRKEISFSIKISLTRFSTNTDRGFLVLNQCKTHCESDHKIRLETFTLNSFTRKLAALTPINTANSSKRGMVISFDCFFFFLAIGTKRILENKRLT